MTDDTLIRLFEHNNWANLQTLQACAKLTDEQLDAAPQSVTKGSIRRTLVHLVSSQRGYLELLTLPVEARVKRTLPYDELEGNARSSGEALVMLVKGLADQPMTDRLQTTDGYYVDPWVVLVQIINHATEHREQVNSMLSALGITPPNLDGWAYGEETGTLVPIGR